MLVRKSTVEILVIPPFLAAVWMLASPPSGNSTPRILVVEAVPTLDPTGLLVAATGPVNPQEEARTAKLIPIKRIMWLSFILKWLLRIGKK